MRAALVPVVASLVLLVAAPSARAADAPAFTSANGRFTATVRTAVGGESGRLGVYEGDASRPGAAAKWECELTGPVASLHVLVSDDGAHAVTLDNRARPASGDHVVGVYCNGRRVVEWPLEQALLPSDLKALRETGWDWPRSAIALLADFNDRRYLAMWLTPLGRWQVWDLTAVRKVPAPAPPLVERCNDLARPWALAQLERPGGQRLGAIGFLGALRDPRDRALLERQLAADDDYGSAEYRFQDTLHRVTGRSATRKAADAALAAWDGRTPAPVVPGPAARARVNSLPELAQQRRELRQKIAEHYRLNPNDPNSPPLRAADRLVATEKDLLARFLEQQAGERYVFLGVVDVTARLPERPSKGSLWVYLLPENVTGSDWSRTCPTCRVRCAFNDPPPGGYPTAVPVRFEGVTPGRYWVKAVYDAAEPFWRDPAAACTPSPGDYESAQRTPIDAAAGKVASCRALECTTPCPKESNGVAPRR
jgi:hypothetical protein